MESVSLPMLASPIRFAVGGASAHEPQNTRESLELALKLGATGVWSRAQLTSDAVVVLSLSDRLASGARLRKPKVSATAAADLPESAMTLTSAMTMLRLPDAAGSHLLVEVETTDGLGAVQGAIDDFAPDRFDGAARIWVASADRELLRMAEEWRRNRRERGVRLVDITALSRMHRGPERHAADAAEAGVDAVQMPAGDWTGGLTTLFHRFGVLAFAGSSPHVRVLVETLATGVDAVSSDHVDRMMDAVSVNSSQGAATGGAPEVALEESDVADRPDT